MTRQLLLLSAIASLLACTREFPEPHPFACPEVPIDAFRNVSAVVEKRCGTLDCHGDLGRPLRIMGSTGLRLYSPESYTDPSVAEEAGTTPGGQAATTPQELEQNRLSLCGVEPEKTEQVMTGELDPAELMIITKPTERERHKGAQVLFKGGAGESCIASWLLGEVIAGDCIEEIQSP